MQPISSNLAIAMLIAMATQAPAPANATQWGSSVIHVNDFGDLYGEALEWVNSGALSAALDLMVDYGKTISPLSWPNLVALSGSATQSWSSMLPTPSTKFSSAYIDVGDFSPAHYLFGYSSGQQGVEFPKVSPSDFLDGASFILQLAVSAAVDYISGLATITYTPTLSVEAYDYYQMPDTTLVNDYAAFAVALDSGSVTFRMAELAVPLPIAGSGLLAPLIGGALLVRRRKSVHFHA